MSTDCETDGPTPDMNSMLSFASAAYTTDKKLIGTFRVQLNSNYFTVSVYNLR